MHNLTENYPEISEAIRVSLFENFAEGLDEFGLFESDSVSEVCCQSYDGFIPHTNGGFTANVMQLLSDHYNTAGREADIIAPYVESSENDAAAEFVTHRSEDCDPSTLGTQLAEAYDTAGLSRYGEKGSCDFVYNWFNERESDHETLAAQYLDGDLFGDKSPAFYSTPAGILLEEYQEFSNEWISEGGEYWLQARALFYAAGNHRNETGSDEVFFFAGVNTDFTYGRDKGLESTWERTYKLDRLTPARVRVIVAAMQNSITE